ncbi:MAG: potassium channel family protein [Bacteroidota bacterium]|nr:potassium channel family protein [Bacteroidota bacterium]
MEVFLILLGVFILFFCLIDILWTTLWTDGSAGPITEIITVVTWKIHRKTIGKISSGFLSLSETLILFNIFLTWILLLFIGWYLIFLANTDSVIDAQTEAISNWVDKLYFVAYSLTTLGNGDLKPSKGIYQVLTPIIAASGFATLSLSISYLISVVSAGVYKRNVASKITSIGHTTEDFIINIFTGRNFISIDLVLNTISSDLNMLNEQLKTYPALHYFHVAEYKKSIIYALSVLFDAINVLEFGLNEKEKPSPLVINNLRKAIDEYLKIISNTKLIKKEKDPPGISFQKIKESEIEIVDEGEFISKTQAFKEKRKLLYGLVKKDGWDWYSLMDKK